MASLKQPHQLTGRKVLLFTFVLLPIACLLWQWNALPDQVPLHFSRGGADAFGSKYALIGVVLMPLLLYAAFPYLNRVEAGNAAQRQKRQLGIGGILFLSFALCVWLLAGMPLDR